MYAAIKLLTYTVQIKRICDQNEQMRDPDSRLLAMNWGAKIIAVPHLDSYCR